MEPVTHVGRSVANPIYTGGADRIILNDALYEGMAESTTGRVVFAIFYTSIIIHDK